MKLCEKCVMRVSNRESICKDCRTFSPSQIDWGKKEKELRELLQTHKGKGRYDCIVALTGGKDSSYVLYYMTKVLGARVLAHTWDNGLVIKNISWENIRNAVKSCECDHEVFRYDDEKIKKLLRSLFKYIGTICFCAPFFTLSSISAAIREKVPFIINGASEGQRDCEHIFTLPSQKKQKKHINKLYKTFSKLFLKTLKKFEPQHAREIHDHIMAPLRDSLNKKIEFYPVMIPLSNFVNWTSFQRLENLLNSKLNWKRKPEGSFSHTSCPIESIRGFFEYKVNSNTPYSMISELSSFVRIGAKTREEAIEEIQKLCLNGTRPNRETIKLFSNFIGISEDEFDYYIGKTIPLLTKLTSIKLAMDVRDMLGWIAGAKNYKKGRIIRS